MAGEAGVGGVPTAHKTPLVRFVVDLLYNTSTCCGFVSLLGQSNNLLDLNKLINCGKMSDTDDVSVLSALMSAVSATTLIITLVADADATKHKRRPRRKHLGERR